MTKRKIITYIIIGLGIGGTYWYFSGNNTDTTNATEIATVASGSISSSVKTTGNISPVQTSTLTFNNQGTVTKIYKHTGDTVKTGDVIAEIDASDAYLDIKSAQINLENAQNSYNKLFSETKESDKIQARNTYTENQSTLTLLEEEYKNLITTQKNTLAQKTANITLLEEKVALAQSEYEYAQKNINTDTSSNNLERDIANAFLTLEEVERMLPDIIEEFKDNSLIEDKTNVRYGDLSAKDMSIKNQTETLYKEVVTEIATYSKNLSTLRNKSTRGFDEVNTLVKSARTLMNNMLTLSTLIISEYNNSIEGTYLRADDMETIKTATRTRSTEISNKISTINTMISTLQSYGNGELEKLADKNTLASKKQTLMSAQNDLNTAKKEWEALQKEQETTQKTKQEAIQKQKNTIELNGATYKELLAGPDSTEINSVKNSISSARINLEKAQSTLKDYQIIASFDGVINDIPWNIGDQTSSSEGILIENKDAYEIELSLDQVDIVKVKSGMPAKIILDAFPTETYTGTVSRVSAVPTETSGVVSYTAVVELSIPRSDIYAKMSTTVEIIIANKENILTLSSSAITTTGGKTTVKKLRASTGNPINTETASGMTSNETTQGKMPPRQNTNLGELESDTIEIVTGISSDGKTEILSGLSLGDRVIVTSTTQNTTTTSSSSNNRNSGFGGPPGGF